jgi:hypothetical protein
MKLSFDRFYALTVGLAVGASVATGCATEDSEDNGAAGSGNTEAAGGSAGSRNDGGAPAASGSGSAQAGSAGLPSAEGGAGAPSTEGGAGAPGTAGSAGAPSTEGGAGAPSTEGGAGAPSTEGGAGAPSTEGGAGAPSTEGGAGAPGTAGSAGSTGEAGAAGASAGAGGESCVSGEPASEGGGIDCEAVLPYANETCPNPSGESMAPLGVSRCWQYAQDRQDAVAVLADCLKEIDGSEDGYCGDEHEAAVDACVAKMNARTCTSTAAQTACANIAAVCADVEVAPCVADLSVFGDDRIAYVESCASAEGGPPSSACAYNFRSCKGDPDRYIPVEEACADVKAKCPAVDSGACETRLDIYGGGALLEPTYYFMVAACMQTEQEQNSASCGDAYETCTAVWAD